MQLQRLLRRCAAIVLVIAVVILYLNFGYLVAYSLDPAAQQSVYTDLVRTVLDPLEFLTKHLAASSIAEYISATLLWPFILIICWMVTAGVFTWQCVVWLFTGGFWRWLGIIP